MTTASTKIMIKPHPLINNITREFLLELSCPDEVVGGSSWKLKSGGASGVRLADSKNLRTSTSLKIKIKIIIKNYVTYSILGSGSPLPGGRSIFG